MTRKEHTLYRRKWRAANRERMVEAAIKAGHLRAPTVIAQEITDANARLAARAANEAALKQNKFNKRADEVLDALTLLPPKGGTPRYIERRAVVLAAMQWAMENAEGDSA